MLTMPLGEIEAYATVTDTDSWGLCFYGLSEIIGANIKKETGFKEVPSARLDAILKKSGIRKLKSIWEMFFSAAVECKILFRMNWCNILIE